MRVVDIPRDERVRGVHHRACSPTWGPPGRGQHLERLNCFGLSPCLRRYLEYVNRETGWSPIPRCRLFLYLNCTTNTSR